jgi:hypothetical protein
MKAKNLQILLSFIAVVLLVVVIYKLTEQGKAIA